MRPTGERVLEILGYDRKESENKTQIMRDAIQEGYNVKEVAGYFRMHQTSVYQRIKMKKFNRNVNTSPV